MRYSRPTTIVIAVAFLFGLAAVGSVSAQVTRHVPADYATIQDAIDASVNGDTVLIAPGTYFENIDFVGKAITVRGAAGPEVTLIDGQNQGTVVVFQNNETSTSVLMDVTILHGRGADAFGFGFVAKPGGIHVFCASPIIRNCIIRNNEGGNAGDAAIAGAGGIGCEGPCPEEGFQILNCGIRDNVGGSAVPTPISTPIGEAGAGGIHCIEAVGLIRACVIEDNQGGTGAFAQLTGGAGGIEFSAPHGIPVVEDCDLVANWGGDAGDGVPFAGAGGIHGGSPEILFCRIWNNHGGQALGTTSGASAGAGGIFGDAPTITNCLIEQNVGGSSGLESVRGGAGGVCVLGDATILTTLIDRNLGGPDGGAPGFGGAGGVESLGGSMVVLSSTIADNIGAVGFDGSGSGGIHLNSGTLFLKNAIVWDNVGGGFGPFPSSDEIGGLGAFTVTYCNVKNGYPGVGNIALNPDFKNQAAGDYHLKLASHCIDAAEPGSPAPTQKDVDCDPRLLGFELDMGADEANAHIYPGSGEDLILETVVNDSGDPSASVRFLTMGDVLKMTLRSPLGTFAPPSMVVVGQFFMTGSPPAHPPGFPEVRVDPVFAFVMAPGPIPNWQLPITGGFTWGFNVPMTYPGFSLMLQGFAVSPLAANGFFAATEGHELRFE